MKFLRRTILVGRTEIDIGQKRACTVINKKTQLTGIIVGLVLNANLLGSAISSLYPIKNIFAYLLLIFAFLSIAINRKIAIKIISLVVCAIIAIQLIYSGFAINSEMTKHFMLCAVSVALPCMLISMYGINLEAFFRTIIISSIICTPYIISLMVTSYTVYNSGHQMGIAYSILPCICSAIYCLFLKKKTTVMKFLTIISLLLMVPLLFMLQTRGSYLCLFVFIMGFIYLKIQSSGSKKAFIILLIILMVGVTILIFGERILASNWFARVFGVKENNILNGREVDYAQAFAWRGVAKFLFGSGIGSFQKYGYTEYIHNIIGQVYYEQGILCAIFVVIIIIRAIKLILSKDNVSNFNAKVYLLLLTCIGVIRLMVSYYFWIDQSFWILLWLMAGRSYKKVLIQEIG